MEVPFFAGDLMFQFVSIFIGIIFVIIIGTILFSIFKGIGQWQKNENSPKLIVPAIVKSKRTDVRRSGSINNEHHHTTSHTRYYVTFEFESGDRSEFLISGNEYGLLSEGDIGKLTFQGTRFLGFTRKQVNS
ncbi:DUF2500 domain-containing protein [Litchfieldia salsa]|uniref:DUF2500 domain-containing protein n=1 Tax=Litchfieldia salsa TaxID=930152 RepID=A0A1H0RW78_9BACI|nr:DUF2500 domain-containing protein [Litchfieldia salsa]SDP33683.1 Protein of unknown function [Litchfieldia salsa]